MLGLQGMDHEALTRNQLFSTFLVWSIPDSPERGILHSSRRQELRRPFTGTIHHIQHDLAESQTPSRDEIEEYWENILWFWDLKFFVFSLSSPNRKRKMLSKTKLKTKGPSEVSQKPCATSQALPKFLFLYLLAYMTLALKCVFAVTLKISRQAFEFWKEANKKRDEIKGRKEMGPLETKKKGWEEGGNSLSNWFN